MTPFIVIIILLAASIAPFLISSERVVRYISIALSLIAALGMLMLSLPVLQGSSTTWYGGSLATHSFGALMIVLVAIVYIAASIVSVRYISRERAEGLLDKKQARLYFSLIHLFVLCMFVTLLANNTMLLWIALEGTTLSTTLLVALYKSDASIEAAWKYIILCSTGIGIGLLGVMLSSYSAMVGVGASITDAFSLDFLLAHASQLDPSIIRFAFVFLFVGFGTKAGLVPMHTWKPDAYSKAPAPISALFSGVLLNVALYTIVRYKTIVDSVLESSKWTDTFFITFGVISVVLPAVILIVQHNYKRMLAYSSVEHAGLMTFAFGLGPIGTVAALMHMVGHSLIKSGLFFGAGEILMHTKTTKLDAIRGLSRTLPITSWLWIIGLLGLLGAPPFALFASEYQLIRGGFVSHPVLTLLIVTSLTVVAVSMMRHVIGMLFGEPIAATPTIDAHGHKTEQWNLTHTIIVLELIALVVVGFWFMTEQGYSFIQTIASAIRF